jgi:4-hydroxy-3-polyprenylbenzoate decarboxylase
MDDICPGRFRLRQLVNGISRAPGQKNNGNAKADRFEHAAILLKAKADSSRMRNFNSDSYFCWVNKPIILAANLKILVAMTGASGALYAQRLLDNLNPRDHEIHVVQSNYAQQVIAEELAGGLTLPEGAKVHNLKSMNAPFASGSNPADAMVVIPCTMGTMGRIAHGYSEDVLLRAADVVIKEKKKLILVPRETPLSLVHVKNMELLLLAGATILPANPSFYSGAKTIVELADTVVARVLDHLGIKNDLAPRWAEEKE